MMKIDKFFLIIEIILISLYMYTIIFSILILPLNIILGILCILFLPGYNLLNLIKPNFSIIQKTGYMTIISLGLENIIMFFSYIFLYDIVTTPENPAFYFNNILLITSIQIINIVLIIINQIKRLKVKEISATSQDDSLTIKKGLKIEKDILLNFIAFIGFCFSLTFLGISVFKYEKATYRFLYSYDFTFFYNLPYTFYIFLITTIISLTYIIIYSKNRYLILISLSMFLYCLWILPYLQFGDYFNDDSHALFYFIRDYQIYGIRAYNDSCFLIYNATKKTITDFGYSTSLFTGIILMYATTESIDVVLWYIYPIIFITIPFFFYSIFERFLEKKIKTN